jgi:lysophospholipase L1-like esterase
VDAIGSGRDRSGVLAPIGDRVTTPRATRVPRARRWAARIGLLLLGAVLPLLLLEAIVRLFGPVLPGNYSTGTFLTTDPVYGRFHVLDFDGWVKTDEFVSHVTTNSLGLRGPERPYAKPPGVRRVLVLGDSFAEAAQVSEQEGNVSRLEQILNGTDGPRYDVINGGVGGWGTGQELLFLQADGYRYQPDLVMVLLYLGNDVFDNSWELQGRPANVKEPYFTFHEDGSFEPLPFRNRKPDNVGPGVAWLRDNTMLWNIFETGVLQKLTESQADADVQANRFNLNKMLIHSLKSSERQDSAWRVTLTLLQRVREFDESRGIQTAIVVAPAAYQVYDADWTTLLEANDLRRDQWSPTLPNEVLAEHADQIGAPMLDLLPELRASAEGGPRLYYPYNKHWTADGHAVAAQAIADFLTRQVGF